MTAHKPIDFAGLAAALLRLAYTLVPRWLPNGVERSGRWYIGDFDGSPGESANVNLNTGQWYDNAGGDEDKGGDLISLYARIHNLNNGQAALELMRDLGWAESEGVQTPAPSPKVGRQAPAPVESDAPHEHRARGRNTKWRPIVPVPANAPEPRFRFAFEDKKRREWIKLDAVRTWEYAFEGQRFGYVARFERASSEGEIVKDTLPLTWCEDTEGNDGLSWRWKAWDAPRPLYVPATLLSGDLSLPVVVVEGEKCAQAGHQLLGHEFDFVSWPGGCKTWPMAAWGWVMGRNVYLWPDCDAQREPLTRVERAAEVDRSTKPVLPAHKQPGMRAMVGIGSLLKADLGCDVYMCNIPQPGAKPDGWDIADAIADGWTVEDVRAFIRGAHEFVPPDDASRARAVKVELSTPSKAGADVELDVVRSWRLKLLENEKGVTRPVRENVVLALDGMTLEDGKRLPGVPEAEGLIAFNEFTNNVDKLRSTPWGTPAGPWDECDELLMGEWLVRQHRLPSMPRATLEEAVLMVAKRHSYHPVRDDLEQRIRGSWDGTPRLATWLRRCCLEEDEYDDADPLQQYLARVGTWLLMALCARVLTPGCKFDYMVIFEGAQGVGKSTLARVLGGEYYADTGLMLGDKDSYQNLQGVLVYEMGELDALNKSEITKIKLFISSMKDRFRASFDRRPKDYPRQVAFIGTTNEDHYLNDPTGNRRMWPVRVTRQVDIAWLRENRDQLFAEALAYVDAGERFHPTPKEQRELFEPQQQQRAVENAIESAIARYLYPVGNPTGPRSDGGELQEVTLVELLGKVGIGLEKLGPGRFHEKQAASALRRLGWTEARSSRPGRPRVYRRPSPSQDRVANEPAAPAAKQTEDADACPF